MHKTQFKSKSKAKRRQMAIEAKLSKMDEKEKAEVLKDLLKGFDQTGVKSIDDVKNKISVAG